MTSSPTPEFSFEVKASTINSENGGATFEHEADEAERDALAARFGLVGLPAFRFTATLKPTRTGNGFRLKGVIVADVVQRCVVTLEPVAASLEETFEILLFDEADCGLRAGDIEDDYETFAGDIIDLGEIASVELALRLDPYPRVPSAIGDKSGPGGEYAESHDHNVVDKDTENPTYRPFAGLAALRRNR